MRRMWAASAAMLVCLVLGGMPALAQKASNSPTVSPVVVSGTWGCTKTDPGTRGTSDGLMWGGTGARDQVLECDLALSDPRVIGPTTITFNDDCFGAECIFWGTLVIEGPDGGGSPSSARGCRLRPGALVFGPVRDAPGRPTDREDAP